MTPDTNNEAGKDGAMPAAQDRKWTLELHGGFRSGLVGEDWPFGYISEGVGKPVFALHEVIGERSVEELMAAAQLAVSAPELLEALEASALALDEAAKLLFAKGLQGCAGIMCNHANLARQAAAKARGDRS